MNNASFKLENEKVLYYSCGCRTLNENLNDLEKNIIFIKNSDNVRHQSQVEETIDSKKKLASIIIEMKEQIVTAMWPSCCLMNLI